MSILAVNRIALDLEHRMGLIDEYRSDPQSVLDRYRLSSEEREAVVRLDAQYLLDAGVNPIVIRNLLVILGIPHSDMYTHDRP
jgi:hypothetical protein